MNNKQNSSGLFVIIGIAVVILVALIIVANVSSSPNDSSTKTKSSYEKSLYDAYEKKKNGEILTQKEQRAWDDFKEWERKNY